MPIIAPDLPRFDSSQFSKLDYAVMGHAFACHNDLGRLCDESVYQTDLADRLNGDGIHAETETRIQVTYQDFTKLYRLDLVVANQFVYELKVASALDGEHEAQLLNYLMLTNTAHGKLVNFRPARVDAKFVNAPVDAAARRKMEVFRDEFSPKAAFLRDIFLELAHDWGLFLDLALYTASLTHFLGGEKKVIATVPMKRNGRGIGTQEMHMVDETSAFRVTGFKENLADQESHLRRLLSLTPLEAIHWINLCRNEVSLMTLS